jgi:hypothetical protein
MMGHVVNDNHVKRLPTFGQSASLQVCGDEQSALFGWQNLERIPKSPQLMSKIFIAAARIVILLNGITTEFAILSQSEITC